MLTRIVVSFYGLARITSTLETKNNFTLFKVSLEGDGTPYLLGITPPPFEVIVMFYN